MPLRLIALKPRRQVVAVQGLVPRIDREVRDYIVAMSGRMATYPPARPWTSRPPKSGPRAGGRRTGTLGRSWQLGMAFRRLGPGAAELVNRVPYAVWVQGPRGRRPGQTAVMASRGWQNIRDEAQAEWERRKPRIQRILRTGR